MQLSAALSIYSPANRRRLLTVAALMVVIVVALAPNILLVDDHALFRDSVARFLDSESDIHVVGGCATIDEAREFLRQNVVDLVLLDFDLGQRDGIDFMRAAESIGYQGKVLLVTAGVEETSAANLVKRGIAGVFLKHDPPAVLVDAIRSVLSGKVWFEQDYLHKIVGCATVEELPRTRKLSANNRCWSASLKD